MKVSGKKQKIKANMAKAMTMDGSVISANGGQASVSESGEVVKFNEAGMPPLDVWLENETIWLTQAQSAALFGVKLNTINYHIKTILKSGELTAEVTIRKIRIVQIEGGRRDTLMPALPETREPIGFHT